MGEACCAEAEEVFAFSCASSHVVVAGVGRRGNIERVILRNEAKYKGGGQALMCSLCKGNNFK